jgi:hypothetical protein
MPTLLMQYPAAGIEIALFRPEAVPLVMISPLALLYTPVVVIKQEQAQPARPEPVAPSPALCSAPEPKKPPIQLIGPW